MTSKWFKVALLTMCLALFAAPLAAEAQGEWKPGKAKPGLTLPMAKLKCEMQGLWYQHGDWTHQYIVSAIAGLEGKELVLARLLQNQQDIGSAFKPYYGDEVGNKLAALLTEHIQIAGKLLDALIAGNKAEADKQNKAWYRNADDIAKFWNGINPNWTYPEMKQLWDTHLKLLTDQISARLTKNWAADISAYDKGQEHLMKIADVLSVGIIKQFPNKF